MDTNCPNCGKLYTAKRKRCYSCKPGFTQESLNKPRPNRRTGETLNCVECGRQYYVSRAQLEEYGSKYCSRECKYLSMKGSIPKCGKFTPDKTIQHSAGYLLSWCPEHPRASRGRVLEHILVMERLLGRYLEPGEVVHHKDRNRSNNSPDNLELMTSSEHSKLHQEELREFYDNNKQTLICAWCSKEYKVKRSKAKSRKYCSLSCKHKKHV